MRIAFVTILGLICVAGLSAEPVPVRHTEGIVHGFLALRELDGTTIADGDLIQNAHGDRVTVRLDFHFKDGSLHRETAVYSQRREFRPAFVKAEQRLFLGGPVWRIELVSPTW